MGGGKKEGGLRDKKLGGMEGNKIKKKEKEGTRGASATKNQ